MIRTFCNFSQWVFYNKQLAQTFILGNLPSPLFLLEFPVYLELQHGPEITTTEKLLLWFWDTKPWRYFDLVVIFLVLLLCTERWFPLSTLLTLESLFAFLFVSRAKSQNVNISQLLTCSKFKVSKQSKAVEVLCFVLSHITWWKKFAAVKINEAVRKRIWKASWTRYVVSNEEI